MRLRYLLTTTAFLCLSTSAFAADPAPTENAPPPHADRPPMMQPGNKPMGDREGGMMEGHGGPGGMERPHPMLSEEQKKSLHACAKQGGVELPPPSPEGRPHLNDDQRKIVHACFEKLGIKPPHPPRDGQHGPGSGNGETGHPPMIDDAPTSGHPHRPPMDGKPPQEKPPAPTDE